jgi:hypothetical protein
MTSKEHCEALLSKDLFLENKLLRATSLMDRKTRIYGNGAEFWLHQLAILFEMQLYGLFVENALFGIMAALYGANPALKDILYELEMEKFRTCPWVPCEKLCGKCVVCRHFTSCVDVKVVIQFNFDDPPEVSAPFEDLSSFGAFYRNWFKTSHRCMGLYKADEYSRFFHDQCENVVIDNVFCQYCQQNKGCLVALYDMTYPEERGDIIALNGRNARRLPPHQLVKLVS